jgi:hypothetical protein
MGISLRGTWMGSLEEIHRRERFRKNRKGVRGMKTFFLYAQLPPTKRDGAYHLTLEERGTIEAGDYATALEIARKRVLHPVVYHPSLASVRPEND